VHADSPGRPWAYIEHCIACASQFETIDVPTRGGPWLIAIDASQRRLPGHDR
jgi:hypothetical protein